MNLVEALIKGQKEQRGIYRNTWDKPLFMGNWGDIERKLTIDDLEHRNYKLLKRHEKEIPGKVCKTCNK